MRGLTMKTKPKFDFDEIVYCLHNNDPVECKVVGIRKFSFQHGPMSEFDYHLFSILDRENGDNVILKDENQIFKKNDRKIMELLKIKSRYDAAKKEYDDFININGLNK